MTGPNLLINMLINDPVSRLMVCVRRRSYVYGLLLKGCLWFRIAMVNTSRVPGFMGHGSLENIKLHNHLPGNGDVS